MNINKRYFKKKQDWDLDGLGNWGAFYDDDTDLQARTHSEYNEIVAASGINHVQGAFRVGLPLL